MSDDQEPSPNGANGDGRDSGGRFAKGWKGGPGNPHSKQVAQVREALMRAVTPEKIERAVTKLLDKAENGDVMALREVLDRVLGRPAQADLLERIERLEHLLSERSNHGNATSESQQN